MFDFVHKNKRLIQIVLAIIFLPFAFFGVESYFNRSDSDNFVAKIGDQPISQREFSQALQDRQNAIQRMLGGKADPAFLNSTEMRMSALDNLIQQRLLIAQAVRNGILIPDAQLQEIITQVPAFQQDGKFSPALYEQYLKNRGEPAAYFEAGLRRDLMMERSAQAYQGTGVIANSVADRLLHINAQQREASQFYLSPAQYAAQVKLEPDAPRKYYDEHKDQFQIPEQARVEYIVYSLDAVAGQVPVTPEEVKQFYEQNPQQYRSADERQASHILIDVEPGATADAKKQARARAEEVLKQARQNPAGFADLARKYSKDTGSSAKGGDLGMVPRGAMVKPFDDALFSMKQGEIAGPVETQYGYHIIRLTAVKGQGFDGVKAQVESDLKRQKAGKKFSEQAEQLNNVVFEQGDSLKPAADALKLQVQQSGWLSRTGSDNKLLNNPRLLNAVFSDDVLKNKRNTEVIDVGNNTLVAARLLEHKPASTRPFEEVAAAVTKQLAEQQAARLAAKDGREMLAKLRQGGDASIKWSPAKTVSREDPQGFAGPVLAEVFKVDAGALPAYGGIENPQGGYSLVKVSRVINSETIDPAKRKSLAQQLRQMAGQEELSAYVASLKLKADVQINKDRLGKAQE
jgi:peptidyl-prolyl cis-trans isomerase D